MSSTFDEFITNNPKQKAKFDKEYEEFLLSEILTHDVDEFFRKLNAPFGFDLDHHRRCGEFLLAAHVVRIILSTLIVCGIKR